MGASLDVLLANVWIKLFEASSQKSELIEPEIVFPRTRSRMWVMQKFILYAKFQKITNEEYGNILDVVWFVRNAAFKRQRSKLRVWNCSKVWQTILTSWSSGAVNPKAVVSLKVMLCWKHNKQWNYVRLP